MTVIARHVSQLNAPVMGNQIIGMHPPDARRADVRGRDALPFAREETPSARTWGRDGVSRSAV